MRIERKELQAALSAIRPAIATKDPLTQLLCVWFSGERVFAYNGTIGIDVPLKSDFKGGVAGAPLVGLVGSSVAKQAELSVETAKGKNDLLLKMGTSKSRLPSQDFEQAVWSFPKLPKEGIEIDEVFLTALSRVLIAATDEYGVSLICEDDKLTLYATNNRSLAWHTVKNPGFPKTRLEISPIFCEQLLALCSDGGKLYIAKDSVLATSNDGARLFSRLTGGEPLDYDVALQTSLPKGYSKMATEIPDKLMMAYDRALVMTTGEFAVVEHTVEEEVLRLNLKSQLGSLDEKIPMKGTSYQVAVSLDIALVRKGLATTDRIVFTEDGVVLLWGKQGGYIVAALAN